MTRPTRYRSGRPGHGRAGIALTVLGLLAGSFLVLAVGCQSIQQRHPGARLDGLALVSPVRHPARTTKRPAGQG